MTRGPLSRMKKVPVKCSNCGKIKYNVVYEEIEPKEVVKEKPIKEEVKDERINTNNTLKNTSARPKTHYISDIIANQKRLADKYNISE